ncbi:MAG: hypothetical protein FWE77_00575 [Clostridia bacterium]|nr:hypothetical protein [Clostridia bacterium]
MRNRTNFHFTPAQGSVVYAPQQAAAPLRSTDIINYDRLLMLLFFAAIPFLGIVSMLSRGFLQSLFLTLLFLSILGTVSLLWLKKGFTARGRLSMTTLYAVFAVIALTSLLQGGSSAGAGGFAASGPTLAPISMNSLQSNTELSGLFSGAPDTSAPIMAPGIADREEERNAPVLARSGDSACEQVLVQFLEYWKGGMVTDMVPLTAHSWRQKANFLQNGAEQSLYAQISGKKLDSYTLEGEPTGTDNDTSRTISVLCNVIQKEEPRLIRYQALILHENGQWLVDPNSLMNGTRVDTATPGPGEAGSGSVTAATPQPTPTPKPTPKPKSNLKLYYNPQGGQYYHVDAKCSAVNTKKYTLKSFTYGNIGRSPQRNLSPCGTCKAPDRP